MKKVNRNRTYDPLKVLGIIAIAFGVVMILLSVGTTLISTPNDITVYIGFGIIFLLIPTIIFITYVHIKNKYK